MIGWELDREFNCRGARGRAFLHSTPMTVSMATISSYAASVGFVAFDKEVYK